MNKRRPISRVELILQTSPAENAAAALAMVLSYNRVPVSVEDLMEPPVANAADLVAAAQRRGIYAQGYQMTFDQLAQAHMPLIAHWKFRSFVVVTGVRGNRVYINSPEEGRRVLTRRAFKAGFTGIAVCFAGQGEPEDQKTQPSARQLPWGLGVPALLGASQMLIAVLCLVLAVLSRGIAAHLSAPQAGGGLALCLGLLAMLVLQAAAAAVQTGGLGWCLRRECSIEKKAFQDCLNRERTTFFEKTNRYRLEAAARACSSIPAARVQMTACRMQLVGGIVCLAVVAMQNAAAGAVAAAVAVLLGVVCFYRREILYSDLQLADRTRFLAADRAAEDLEASQDLQLCGETRTRFERWAGMAGCVDRPGESERQRLFWHLAAGAQLLAVLAVCLTEMSAGRAGGADLMGCMAMTAGAAVSMEALPRLMEAQMKARWLRETARGICRPGEKEASVCVHMEAPKALTLQNVSLCCPGSDEIVARGVTWTVRRGEILVVSGEAEVREALAPVASGLVRPRQGEVYLGNTETASLSEAEICRKIVLLGGGLPFPEGTVRQNIAASLPDITDYAVMEAASDALLHESILGRKEGYDTPVSALSAGERVLLEFAGAFAEGVPFLVCNGLMEILDPDTEDRLIRSLCRRGVGTVLLTGDPAQLRKGDLACRIQGGQVTLRERGELVDKEVSSLV